MDSDTSSTIPLCNRNHKIDGREIAQDYLRRRLSSFSHDRRSRWQFREQWTATIHQHATQSPRIGQSLVETIQSFHP
ncbi:hypothetical protein GQ602_002075 [Ophiocordyceps camponoti-floridani]|uniref:Uncharacterized protein n=1 Tax=Ophiocordyceps camponoti-floridani TaxID=2030778 RepID=A0A8H4VF13_9HYPO|nr:hypothetical protein GQ602_007417 [Ophiocordyceps camponoti-floridani]KAF4591776.1 hypothetical protein GQ602_002075 [Ophiocordyceps camponoti-floridani]